MKIFTKATICLLPFFLLSGISSSYAQYTGTMDGLSYKFDCEWSDTRSITIMSKYTTGWDGEQAALDNCSVIVYLDSSSHKQGWDYNDDVFNSVWHEILTYTRPVDINLISGTMIEIIPDVEGSDEKFIEHHNGFKIAILGGSESDDCSRDTAKYINVVSASQQEPTLEDGAECHIMVKLDPTSRSKTDPKEVSHYDVHKDGWFFSDREFQDYIRQINDFQLNIPIHYNMDFLPTYAVGDVGPAGGVVLLISEDGQHGIEVTERALEGKYEWGCKGVVVLGTNDGIGHGKANTRSIMDKECTITGEANNAEPKYAALAAHDHIQNSFDDWFLPATTTALKIKTELIDTGIINSNGCLWTSVSWYNGGDSTYYSHVINQNSPDGNSGRARGEACEVFPVRNF
ncbi:MAG: hypothetical protein KAG45_10300 [Methyloprofundus sp.]|nr:hypothetical protein [Methyloprofundus sp.]